MRVWAWGLVLVACVAGCKSGDPEDPLPKRWDGKVQRWGSVREVLRGGDKTGKVELGRSARTGFVGLGALAGLEGEVLVLDGQVWTTRAGADGILSTRRAQREEEAAMLAVARIPRWRERKLKRDLDYVQLEPFLRTFASKAKIDDTDAFPFIVRGRVESLQSHVLAGRCPYSSEGEGADPVRERRPSALVTLVGFYSSLPPGELTHHGTRLHMHVLIEDEQGKPTYVGHVDSVRIPKGVLVQVPRPPAPTPPPEPQAP